MRGRAKRQMESASASLGAGNSIRGVGPMAGVANVSSTLRAEATRSIAMVNARRTRTSPNNTFGLAWSCGDRRLKPRYAYPACT